MNTVSAKKSFLQKAVSPLLLGLLLFIGSYTAKAQLGIYEFTGAGACPNQNAAVTLQPVNAVFSNFTSVGSTCNIANDVYRAINLNNTNNINLSEYFAFTVTPNTNYVLKLDSLKFTHFAGQLQSNNYWYVRSSIDNLRG